MYVNFSTPSGVTLVCHLTALCLSFSSCKMEFIMCALIPMVVL